MAKGDQDAANNAITQNRNTMQNQFATTGGALQTQFGNASSNYNTGLGGFNTNLGNFNPSYSFTSQFNKPPSNFNGSPGSASGYQSGIEQGGASMNPGITGASSSSSYNPNLPDTASFADKVNNLYAKYGKKDTGAGSGITDAGYWSNNALSNASGDQSYVLGRLEKDLQGTGPDLGGGGSSGPQMDLGFVKNWNPESRGYYRNFADTGGYSSQDLQDIRARDVAPTRSIYQNAQDEMARRLAISGGASGANYNAGLAGMARDQSNQIFSQNQATNANIAQMVNQGKQFGTTGLGGLDTTQLGAELSGNEANLGAAMQQNALQTQQEIAGNQNKLTAMGLQLQGLGLSQQEQDSVRNAILANQGQMGNYGLGSIDSQIRASSIPSNFNQGMGNLSSLLSLFGAGSNALGGMRTNPGLGGQVPSSYGQVPGNNIGDYGYGAGDYYGGGGYYGGPSSTDWSSLPGYGTDPSYGYSPGGA